MMEEQMRNNEVILKQKDEEINNLNIKLIDLSH